MKLETILDDCLRTYRAITESNSKEEYEKLSRQYRAFRARILQMDAEKDAEIEQWEIYHGFHMGDIEMIETMREKDETIERLRRNNQSFADALANPEREAWD